MITESATESSLPWLWVIEALASLNQVDVVTLSDFVSKAPKFPETVGKDARELVALRCLESLISSGKSTSKDLPSASGSKFRIDLSESCEAVLHRILAEDPTLDIGITRSVSSKWDVHHFVLQKRGTLPQIALKQLKRSVVEGTKQYEVNLDQMTGLARRLKCSNRSSANELDNRVTDCQIVCGSESLIQSKISSRNEDRGLQSIRSTSVLSSKRPRDDLTPDGTMQNVDINHSKRKKSEQEVIFSHTNNKVLPKDGVGCQGRKGSLHDVFLERDVFLGVVVDDEHLPLNRAGRRSDCQFDVPSTAANVHDLSRDSQAVHLEEVVWGHADLNDGAGCQGRKESLPVCLEKGLSPGGVDDEHLSLTRVEHRSDVRVDVHSTAPNVRDLSRDSQAVGLEDKVWQNADRIDGVGCQGRKESPPFCLERDVSPGVVNDEHLSSNRVEQRNDVQVDVPSTSTIVRNLSGDSSMLADDFARGSEWSVQPHAHPLTASALKVKEKEISDDDLENDSDGSIPLEGADLFFQFEEPDDFFLHKEPGFCIPLEEPDVHISSVEPAIHIARVPHEETNANLPFKSDGCFLLGQPDICIPLPEQVHTPLEAPDVLIPCGKTDDECVALQEPEADCMPHEMAKICAALAEPQVTATDGLEKDTDFKGIANDVAPNSPAENSSDYDLEEIDVVARKSDFLSSQCNLTEDSLSSADWSEFNFCMRCKKIGQLLRCSSAVCPVVVHEVCLFSLTSFDEGNFYCPFCAYSHAIAVYLGTKKKAATERRKLAASLHKEQSKEHGVMNLVDSHNNENFGGEAGSQANSGEEHPSRVGNYSIRELEDDTQLTVEPPITGASSQANSSEEHPSRVGNYSIRELEDDTQLTVEPPVTGASSQANSGEDHPSRVGNYSIRELEDDTQLTAEPPIPGACSQANSGEEHPSRVGNYSIKELEDDTQLTAEPPITGASGQANSGEEHPSRVENYSNREIEDDTQLTAEPPITGASENVSHIAGPRASGRACGAENGGVHVAEPVEVVQGRENEFTAADFVGHETSKDEKKKSAKSRYSPRAQKEKKNYTPPAVPGFRRKKVPWTAEEVKMLKEGFKKLCGDEDQYIPWKEILAYGGTILNRRTAGDLKVKWRNISKRRE